MGPGGAEALALLAAAAPPPWPAAAAEAVRLLGEFGRGAVFCAGAPGRPEVAAVAFTDGRTPTAEPRVCLLGSTRTPAAAWAGGKEDRPGATPGASPGWRIATLDELAGERPDETAGLVLALAENEGQTGGGQAGEGQNGGGLAGEGSELGRLGAWARAYAADPRRAAEAAERQAEGARLAARTQFLRRLRAGARPDWAASAGPGQKRGVAQAGHAGRGPGCVIQ
jgi:hypothetical protein